MTSVCISNCINDARVPVRATYVNLYKWPESDAEFVRSVSSGGRDQRPHQHPRVVDSISCRQLYLKSYTFSRKETVPERTKKCLARAREGGSSQEEGEGSGPRPEEAAGGGGGEEGEESEGVIVCRIVCPFSQAANLHC